MRILAIESSCDETAAAVVEMGTHHRRILSNVVASQIDTHALYGGVVPEIASRAHIEAISMVVWQAQKEAGVSLSDLEAVAVTYTPGLIGCLLVGVSFAKSLAFSAGLPLIPVDHIKAHAAAAYFDHPDLEAPFTALVVSGGHTSLYTVSAPSVFEEIGGTRDDAAGEAFDKVGRILGLPYPGGAAMDALATEGFALLEEGKLEKIPLPSPALRDSFDFSFSGLKTACVNYIHNFRQVNGLGPKDPLQHREKVKVALSFTEAAVHGICKTLVDVMKKTGTKKLVLAGGVAANRHLRRGVQSVAEKYGVALYMPPLKLCGDNGAMVGAQAYYEYTAGLRAGTDLNAFASGENAEISPLYGKVHLCR